MHLHVCKTSITWIIGRCATRSSSSWATLDHSYSSVWVLGWLNSEKYFLRLAFRSRVPYRCSLLSRSISNEFISHSWACYGCVLANFWDVLKAFFLLCQVTWLFFNGIDLYKPYLLYLSSTLFSLTKSFGYFCSWFSL
jgi:hypothetical protein